MASNVPLNSNATGPVISTWSSLSRHSMVSSPPGSVTRTLRFGALEPRRRHRRRAGGRAAGARQTRAALPGADDDVLARDDVRQGDVGALGKDRMVLQQRPEAAEVVGLDVVDPEDRVRIAHVDDRRRMQDRSVDRTDLQFDGAGVAELLRQRNLVPLEARRTHVDGVETAVDLPAIQETGLGLEGERVLAALVRYDRGDAAHAVAAGAGLRAVIVEDADEGVGAGRARRIERHQLVVRRARGRGGRARLLGRDRRRALTQINDDDLVADTVHLDERLVGERAHLNLVPNRASRPAFARFIWRINGR